MPGPIFIETAKEMLFSERSSEFLEPCFKKHRCAWANILGVFSMGKLMYLFNSVSLTLDQLKYFDLYLKTFSIKNALAWKF